MSGNGGGIYNNGGTLTLTDVTLAENEAAATLGALQTARGGALFNTGGVATLTRVTIVGNAARATTTFANSSTFGGGIYNDVSGTLNLSTVTITGNQAISSAGGFPGSASGGGLYSLGTSGLVNVTVTGNTASATSSISAQSTGGGLVNGSGSMLLTTVAVNGNTASATDGVAIVASEGGGILNTGHLALQQVTIADNAANAVPSSGAGFTAGGGISSSGTVNATDLTVRANMANVNGAITGEGTGGGVYNNGSLQMTGAAVIGNTVTVTSISNGTASGAGIRTAAGIVTVTNTTISANAAIGTSPGVGTGTGGGIYAGGGTIQLVNVTVAGNAVSGTTSATAGGIAQASSGSVEARNVLVGSSGTGPNCVGTITSTGGNLDSGNSCGFALTSDLRSTDPLLGSLGDNGGLTETIPLRIGSPARDAGLSASCPSTDQRGVARPQDGNGDTVAACDIGAFEASNSPSQISLAPGTLTYQENAGPVAVDPTLALADSDNPTLAGATVAISAGFVPGEDLLAFTPQAGINGNFVGGTLTLTGTASVASYQTVLRSVTYANTSEAPSPAPRLVTFTVTDGSSPLASASRQIAVSPVDDGPTVSVPGAQTVTEDTAKAITGISVADVDAGSSVVQVSISASDGALTLAQTTGLSFAAGDGTSDPSMVFTGTLANMNAALATVTYQPNPDASGPDTLIVHADDRGNTGTGGPLTDTKSIPITVGAVADPPTVATNTGLTLARGGLVTIPTTALRAADPDTAAASLLFTLTAVPTHGTVLKAGTPLGVGGTFTEADLENNRLAYQHDGAASGTDRFTFTLSDGVTSLAPAQFVLTILPGAPSSAPAPIGSCSPRPQVNLTVDNVSPGVLRVTVQVQTTVQQPVNLLREIRFGRTVNATVDAGTHVGSQGGFAIAPTDGAAPFVFTVRRSAPNQSVTVPFAVTDACGDWFTFVGGGPTAF